MTNLPPDAPIVPNIRPYGYNRFFRLKLTQRQVA